MKVAVLHSQVHEEAPKDELDVIVQAGAVSQALSDLGHEPGRVEFSFDLRAVIDALTSMHPNLIFNLVESVEGHGRLIHTAPAILDYLGIPYTGAGTEAVFLTSHKLMAKKLLKALGIPTPPWFSAEVTQDQWTVVEGLYIIKSLWEHASIGLDEDSVIFASDSDQLRHEMEIRREQLGGNCFAEAFIKGREFNISVLGGNGEPQVLPPAEILFEDYPEGKCKVVGYRAKWNEESFEYQHTPRNFEFPKGDDPLVQQLRDIAKDCWKIFGLRGYARVDFRVDEAGRPWVLEVNANPCISPESGFIAAAGVAGLNYNQTIEKIIWDSRP